MKICCITPWFQSSNITTLESSMGIHQYRQVMNLNERGHGFKIISIKWRGQHSHEIVREGIEVYRLPYIFEFPQIKYPIPNIFKLIKRIKEICSEEKIDLIEFVNQEYLPGAAIFFTKKLGIPTIVDVYGIPGIRWFYGNKIVDTIGYVYEKLLGDHILKSADGIITDNSSLCSYFNKINIDANRIYAITKGVDTELFKPRLASGSLKFELGIKGSDTVILYVGRLDLVKGVDYLLYAAKRIISDSIKDVKFVIVGDGSLRGQYEKFAASFSNNVIFTGYRDDIPELMNIADIFILPSLSEGASMVAMEASASGLPVIATAVGEMPQIISAGETGILVPPKDVNSLIEKTMMMIDNPLLANKMGRSGRKKMQREYSWETICDKLEEAYGEIVSRVTT